MPQAVPSRLGVRVKSQLAVTTTAHLNVDLTPLVERAFPRFKLARSLSPQTPVKRVAGRLEAHGKLRVFPWGDD